MKKQILKYLTLCLTGIFLSAGFNVRAEQPAFDLFSADRGKTKPIEPPTPPKEETSKIVIPNTPTPPPPKLPQKDFILRGTTILGKQRSVVLQAPDGKQIIQRLESKGPTPISGFPEYRLMAVEARKAHISYPKDAPCREDRQNKGVKCRSGDLAELNMVRAKPTAPKVPLRTAKAPVPRTAAPPGHPNAVGNAPQSRTSPTQRNTQQPTSRNNTKTQPFKPRVIKDSEVPPGMKVIRTPFGDRLVPKQ